MSKKQLAILVIVLILLADQILKVWVKTSFFLGEERSVIGDWFLLHFVENRGMAFGFEFAGRFGKVLLTLFRLVAATAIFWYLLKLIKRGIPSGLVISIAMIFAGAVGNIIDSAFYGVLFSDSYGRIATFLPEGGGYETFLHGSVVDMFFFPVITGSWPSWSPINAGESFMFFRPVFNIADSSITIGIGIILVFYRKYFNDLDKPKTAAPDEE
ncbi:lipoprotein signal peptidase [Roseimarinus sediminis]|uniref:lipoprotein signal peptidase n=1 Tax=Roseimarinus sediminis TaxID=1610899 RepID=UPI003D1C9062